MTTTAKGELPVLEHRSVGQSVLRDEDPRLLSGRGSYIADLTLPGAVEMCVLRSPHAHARILWIDATEAAALPGVLAVWTWADTGGAGVAAGLPLEGMQPTVQPALATGSVRYVGEPVVAVVATSRAVAEDACGLVDVDYEPVSAVTDARAGATNGVTANDTLSGNVIYTTGREFGDVDPAVAGAHLTVSGLFTTERISALPIETRGCIASYEWTNGELRLWNSTQIPHFVKSMLAVYLGFPEHKIEVIAPDVGGAFGMKAHLFPEELLVCLLSRALSRPVRWIEDRVENLLTGTHAKQQEHDMALSVAEDGRFLALTDEVIGDGGAYNSFPWTPTVEALVGLATITGVYKIPMVRDHMAAVATNKCPIGAYRGVGWSAPQIARESLVDEAARRLGLSPFEIRRRNVVRPEDLPYTSATDLTFHEGSFLETINRLEEAVGYQEFLVRQREARAQGRYLGLGISIFNEINGVGTRACGTMQIPLTTHDTSTVRIEPSGKVFVTTSLVSQGQGHATTLAQVAADALGVPVTDVIVKAGNTNQTWGMGTWGSRAAVIGSGSVMRAAHVVRQTLLQVAANLLEASPDDLVMADGMISVKGVPAATLPVAAAAGATYFAEATHPAGFDPTLEATATYDPSITPLANGGHAALVEIDLDTGHVSVEKAWVIEDCGVMINPMIVEGQLRGGFAQAIGMALLEEVVYDEVGQMRTTTLLDYLVPTAAEIPDIDIIHIETPSAFTPGGIKGMGESAMISAPAAVINAVNDALAPLGVWLRRVPITPPAIVAALARAR